MPFMTQSLSRYEQPTSFAARPSIRDSLNISGLESSVKNTSILYANRSKKIASKNSCHHTFSIPIECGKRGSHDNTDLELLWSNPHFTQLKTQNNRRIVCGGLQWDIYIHPNQGENHKEFALSVFPVKNSVDDVLPENYKLKYQVIASLNLRSERGDDQKADGHARFDTQWVREIDDIIYDANPTAMADSNQQHEKAFKVPEIQWKATMQRLAFSTDDLYNNHLDEDNDYFTLQVSIRTQFIKKPSKRYQYFGVVGAILLQSEAKLEEQEVEIEKLRNEQDERLQELRQQLQIANKLHAEMQQSQNRLNDICQQHASELGQLSRELQKNAAFHREEAHQQAAEIKALKDELQRKDEEMQQIVLQNTKLKQQQTHSQSEQGGWLQIVNSIQASNSKMLSEWQQQQQQQQQQRWMQQQQLMGNVLQQQEDIRNQQHQLRQQQMQSRSPPKQPPNPFQPQPSSQSNHTHIQPKLSGQQPSAFSHPYSAFPASPQQQPDSNNIGGPSPQSTLTNVSDAAQQQPYNVRVLHQPAFNHLYNNNNSNNNDNEPQQPAVSPTKAQSAGAQSPQFNMSPNINNMPPPLEQADSADDHKQQKEEKNDTPPQSAVFRQSQKVESESLSQNNRDEQTPVPAEVISEKIDAENESLEWQHDLIRAWRWDEEQKKWRGRGKGKMCIYYNKANGLAKIVFTDVKHEKTRLLQYIDGDSHAVVVAQTENERQSKKNEVEWFGRDYTMNVTDPMEGMWKICAPDDEAGGKEFAAIFNKYINAQTGNVSTKDEREHNEEEDDTKSTDSTKPFEAPTATTTTNNAFSFNLHADEPQDSFVDKSDALNNVSTTSWANAFGGDATNNGSSSAWGDMGMWNFGNKDNAQDGNNNEQPKADEQEPHKEQQTGQDTEAAADDDNAVQITFKPLVHLEEQTVESGHEHEEKVEDIAFVKLYRFGKDVTSNPCWKNRASASKVCFYKSKHNGKVRMIAREHETNKLRMNQLVPVPDKSQFQVKGQKKIYQWSAYDSSIAQEEDNEDAGFSLWCIKFETEELANQFKQRFDESSKHNESVASPTKPVKAVSNEKQENEEEEEEEEEAAEGTEEAPSMKQEEAQPIDRMIGADDNKPDEDDETYAGWSADDIALDKARREKAKQDAETAKKFASEDNSGSMNQSAFSWGSGDLFNKSKISNASDNTDNVFSFSEDQRGVDLEAEKFMNKYPSDVNVSFGIDDNADHDGNDDNVAAEEAGSGGLGMGGFSFASNTESNKNKQEDDANNTSGNSGGGWPSFGGVDNDNNNNNNNKADENTSAGGWGNFSGGFSDVQTTAGFGNAQWGNSEKANEFGSFGDQNQDFNFDHLLSYQSRDEKPQSDVNAAGKADAGSAENEDNNNKDEEDNAVQITFKPLVHLEERTVESGHENEKHMQSYDVLKLYRWGKDVTGHPGWKNRASNTKLQFYQHNDSGKVRLVCRENITNKLRLNQLLEESIAGIKKMNEKQVSWRAVDVTIAAEDGDDDKNGFSQFAAKFPDGQTADAFVELFTSMAENNAQLAGA